MKKILVSFSISILSACASSPVGESKKEATSENLKTSAPVSAVEEEPQDKEPAPSTSPPSPPVQAQSSQYAALSEALKNQSDEKIYQAATQILAQSSNDARALNALAMYHYKKARFDLSHYLLSKAIAANPKMAELYSNLGIVQLAQNEKRDAVKSFRRALDINNDEAVAAANLGSIYVQEKDYGKAQIVLETAYSHGIRDFRVLNNYAIALTANHKYDKAEDLYKAILKDNGNSKEALYNYAILLVDNMGKFEDGLEIINRLKFVGAPTDTRIRIIALENKAKAGLK